MMQITLSQILRELQPGEYGIPKIVQWLDQYFEEKIGIPYQITLSERGIEQLERFCDQIQKEPSLIPKEKQILQCMEWLTQVIFGLLEHYKELVLPTREKIDELEDSLFL